MRLRHFVYGMGCGAAAMFAITGMSGGRHSSMQQMQGTPPRQTSFCSKFQAQFDSLALPDPAALQENNAAHLAASREFDSLCAVDARLGTEEAQHFLDEERDRARRIYLAMKLAAD